MIKALPVALTLLLAAGTANAATSFYGSLSGAQETMPNASTATGYGTAILSNDMNILTVAVSWNGLTAPAAAAHIHCCAMLGANGPVAVDLDPFAAITGNAMKVFDLTMASSYGGGFLAAAGGTAELARMRLINGLNGGEAYFNVHNSNFPAGEIRGQIAAVPEPASWAMLIAGFGLVGTSFRQRNTSASIRRRSVVVA